MYKIYNKLKNKINSKCIKNTLLFFVKESKLI